RIHGTGDVAVDDQVGAAHLAFDARVLRHDQHAVAALAGDHVAVHLAIDAQPARKDQVPLDACRYPDQAIDFAFCVTTEHDAPLQGWPSATVNLPCSTVAALICIL